MKDTVKISKAIIVGLAFIALTGAFGEYVISREMNEVAQFAFFILWIVASVKLGKLFIKLLN